MQTAQLLRRNLTHYWRTNLAVLLGVATAVAVLAGALLVGDSVRASLRDLFLQRLGNTDYVITAPSFFREQLATDIQNHEQFVRGGLAAACPMIAIEGTVTHEPSRRVGSGIKAYGIDERFWKFHRQEGKQSPQNREVFLSESLARELGTRAGDSLLLRVEKPSDIPVESLHSKKEDLGSTLRLTVRETLAADALGEFSIQPQQSAVRAVFLALDLLQKEINQPAKVNLILFSETSRNPTDPAAAKAELLGRILKDRTSLEDFGIKLRIVGQRLSVPPADRGPQPGSPAGVVVAGGSIPQQPPRDAPRTHPLPQVVLTGVQQSISLEHNSKMISNSLAKTANETAISSSLRPTSVLSYLANTISSGERSIPYSLVTALDEEAFEELRRSDAGTRGRGDAVTRRDTATRRHGDAETRMEKGRRSETESIPASPRLPIPASPRLPIPPSPHLPVPASALPPIILNEWSARDLGVRVGDHISLEYYLWHEGGRLETKTAEFQLAGVVPIAGLAADRDLVPEYPGITGSESLAEWDPPFPVDLKRIRKQDENYWDQYRTTPKAFIPLATGQELWQSRFGKLTSLRFTPNRVLPIDSAFDAYKQNLRAALDPGQMGFSVIPARAQGLEASRGATDFGEYFLYFSFFLVISALLLTALFFKLGIEQRLREIGVLQAMGFPPSRISALFLAEGMILALIGSVIGLVGAMGYGQLMMLGLRTWWVDAVGTTMLSLHVSPLSLLLGAAGGVLAALLCVVWTLRRLGKESTRSLLAGTMAGDGETRGRGDTETRGRGDTVTRGRGDTGTRGHGDAGTEGHADVEMGETENIPVSPRLRVSASPNPPISPSPRLRVSASPNPPVSPSPRPRVSVGPRLFSPLRIAILLSLMGVLLLIAASFQLVGQVAGFFGSGMLLLAAFLFCQTAWLLGDRGKSISGTGWWPVARLGFRNATYRPGRSVICIALIASAAFIIVSVDAFRRRDGALVLDRKSGSGGFPLLAESLLPLVHDPNTDEGQEALNLAADEGSSSLAGVTFARFRVRPGDDASCLNLYQPRDPRIVAPTEDFIQSSRFTFQDSLAGSSEEKENPWLLLNRESADGAIPVIADANSMTYVLHLKLGDEFVLHREDGPVRLRVVGALADSVFQSELLMAEKHFFRLFPEQEGYRFFLIDMPKPEESRPVAATLEDRLSDFGFDVVPTGERLANFHRVENTYLSTFQMLGGLGLILGTLGMAAVLLRNVLERRRELALLRAVGYNSSHFTLMVVAENALLLFCGLVTGAVCALLAIAPVFFSRHAQLPSVSLGLLLLAVLISGLTASIVATWAVLRAPLLPALRAE